MCKKIQKIAVLLGGDSSEREVSLRSGDNVYNALLELGYEPRKIDPSLEQIPEDIDFAFIALHGKGGEDGTIQGMLEYLRIPYSGCGIAATAISYDKLLTKKMLVSAGLPTAAFIELNQPEDLQKVQKFPQIIKPALEGSSIGIEVVDSSDDLKAVYNKLSKDFSNLFVEDYIKGKEITISVLGDEVFPTLELRPKNRFYDYEAKYTAGLTDFILPARLSDDLEKLVKGIALEAYNFVGCRGAVRVDMMISEEGNPFILELNTVPGMTATSDLPAQANAAGLSFKELVQRIIYA